jgi:regulator of ribonuclease activity A
MTFKTPDLCDEFEAELGKTVRVVAPMFQRYGGRKSFSGQIVTLKIFEDNSLVRESLLKMARARYWSSMVAAHCAALWSATNWPFWPKERLGRRRGLWLHPRLRRHQRIDIGVRALNTHPQKSIKKRAAGIATFRDLWRRHLQSR